MEPRIDPTRTHHAASLAQAPAGLRGLLFDKDGTLFDFQATWGAWTAGFIGELSDGRTATADALAAKLGFDPATRRFAKSSPMIAGTMEVVVAAARSVLPDLDEAALRAFILGSTAAAPQVPVTPLAPLLDDLRARGFALGIATNDAEGPARAQLTAAGVLDRFGFVAGYDSGYGAKPGHGMHAAFCRQVGLAAAEVAMIGDSLHDLASGRAAGMWTVGVLTGPAERDDLAPHADAVLADIAALPGWLGSAGPTRTR